MDWQPGVGIDNGGMDKISLCHTEMSKHGPRYVMCFALRD